MNPVFEIIPEAIFFRETNLICELSSDGLSYIFENEVEKKFHGLSVFHFDADDNISAQLKTIFNEQPLLSKNYKKVCILYTGEECALLPEELYNPGENELLLNTLFGDLQARRIATDMIAEKKVYNVYGMPSEIHKALVDQFPLAAISHHYSLMVKQESNGDLLKVLFYKDAFVAKLIKGGELQIIQNFRYDSVSDVVYHMMNVLRQFNVTDTPVLLGGMIEIDSDLHKELRHYFPNIVFDELPAEYQYADCLKQLPPHYFSYLFSLALCV